MLLCSQHRHTTNSSFLFLNHLTTQITSMHHHICQEVLFLKMVQLINSLIHYTSGIISKKSSIQYHLDLFSCVTFYEFYSFTFQNKVCGRVGSSSCEGYQICLEIYPLAHRCPVVERLSFTEKTTIVKIVLYCLFLFVQVQLQMFVQVCFCALQSVLVYLFSHKQLDFLSYCIVRVK